MEGGVEGGLKVGRERDGSVWRRGNEGRGWECMEVDVGGDVVGKLVETMVAGADLADVMSGADDVHGDVVGGDETGEVEELVQVTLCHERHHYYYNLRRREGCNLYVVVAGHIWIWLKGDTNWYSN